MKQLALLALLLATAAHAQKITYETDESCGCDIRFVDGIETTRGGDRYGFRRYDGTVLTPNIYKHVDEFHSGYCRVWMDDDRCGLIDSTGREVVPCEYHSVNYPSENRILVAKNNRFGYTDLNGQLVIPLQYPGATHFSEGTAAVSVTVDSLFLYCTIIDTAGRQLFPPIFENALPFHDGLAPVRRYERWGLIDRKGNEVLPTIYEYLTVPDQGIFFAGQEDGWALFDYSMKPLTPFAYRIEANPSQGRIAVSRNGKHGYLDMKGREVIPCIYDMASPFDMGRAMVSIDNRFGIIDTTGKAILPLEYAYTDFLDSKYIYYDSLALVEKNGQMTYVNLHGQQAFPYWFAEARHFSEGLAAVRHNGMWGYIDTQGELYLPLVFDYASTFEHGRAQVTYNGHTHVIDRKGRCVRNCNGIISWRDPE